MQLAGAPVLSCFRSRRGHPIPGVSSCALTQGDRMGKTFSFWIYLNIESSIYLFIYFLKPQLHLRRVKIMGMPIVE